MQKSCKQNWLQVSWMDDLENGLKGCCVPADNIFWRIIELNVGSVLCDAEVFLNESCDLKPAVYRTFVLLFTYFCGNSLIFINAKVTNWHDIDLGAGLNRSSEGHFLITQKVNSDPLLWLFDRISKKLGRLQNQLVSDFLAWNIGKDSKARHFSEVNKI